MASSLLAQTIDQLSREKGIDPAVIISALEDAMVVAVRKYYRSQEPMRSEFDPESGQLSVYAVRTIVEQVADPDSEISLAEARGMNPDSEIGGEVHIPKPTDVLGRIGAQTAKQVILQKVREAEREIVHAEFSNRAGELLQCVVKGSDGPDVILDLGRHEGRMTRRDQSRLESYGIGDRLRVVIKELDPAAKTAQAPVSRADAILVQRLFEMEVPEIYDGTVQIRAIAREAGERTKIAVFSRDRDVDPVGACVGMKGMRVQSIIRELRGEKIDIIQWDEDVIQFATNALSPAKVARVSVLDSEEQSLEVVVEDSQLSLAIGKKGQNVRLASKLLGWHIDIKSEEEKRQEVEAQMAGMMSAESETPLEKLPGVGEKTLGRISQHGIATVEALAGKTPEELMEIPGIGEKMVEKIAVAVREFFEGKEAAAAAPPAVSPAEKEAAVPEPAVTEVEAAQEQGDEAVPPGGEPTAELPVDDPQTGDKEKEEEEVEEKVAVEPGEGPGAATE